MTVQALVGAHIVTEDSIVIGHAVMIDQGRISAIMPEDDLPAGIAVTELDGGWLLPGFIDVQVNGGGDVLFNDMPHVEGMRRIAQAHRAFGTTGMMPTLISDHPDVVARAIAAADEAVRLSVPGILGVHIEGPYLNPGKKGIHDASRIIAMDSGALSMLTAKPIGRRIVTLAPETVPTGAVRRLTDAGILVCLGHSTADYDQSRAALAEGAAGFTHLFNAMTPFQSRAPGMVGAALEDRASYCGLIADGFHVHPATMRVALAARGADGIMLVTDAMPPVGGSRSNFSLMGQDIQTQGGTCRGADGTLAGSALTMVQALRNAMDLLGCDIVTASRMASGNPARFLGLHGETGCIRTGLRADLVHLDPARNVASTWIAGAQAVH